MRRVQQASSLKHWSKRWLRDGAVVCLTAVDASRRAYRSASGPCRRQNHILLKLPARQHILRYQAYCTRGGSKANRLDTALKKPTCKRSRGKKGWPFFFFFALGQFHYGQSRAPPVFSTQLTNCDQSSRISYESNERGASESPRMMISVRAPRATALWCQGYLGSSSSTEQKSPGVPYIPSCSAQNNTVDSI